MNLQLQADDVADMAGMIGARGLASSQFNSTRTISTMIPSVDYGAALKGLTSLRSMESAEPDALATLLGLVNSNADENEAAHARRASHGGMDIDVSTITDANSLHAIPLGLSVSSGVSVSTQIHSSGIITGGDDDTPSTKSLSQVVVPDIIKPELFEA